MRLGKKRAFARGLLLTAVTFGIYAIYWWYKAPHEVYRQFELEDEGRDEGVVWLVVGLIFTPLLLVYFWKAVGHIRYVRARLGLREGIRPGSFLALAIGPYTLATMLYVAGALILLSTAPEATDIEEVPDPAGGLILNLWLAAGVIFLGGLVTAMVAFWMFQRDINQVWDGWAARMRELTRPAPLPFGPDPTGAAAGPAPAAPTPPERIVGGCPQCGSASQTVRPGGLPGQVEYTCRNCGHRWAG